VGVQALEAARAGTRAAHAEVELRAQLALFCVRVVEACSQPGIFGGSTCPTLDPAGGFEPRHRGDELSAREPERGRKGLAALVERVLLRDRGMSERTANDDALEGARRPA
jgi:hypothetical protein